MNEIYTTIIGNVATKPRTGTANGTAVTSFRLASTPRRFEQGRGFTDRDTSFFTVTCWRGLAESVASSVGVGDPVLVHGRLRVAEWQDDHGATRVSVEIDAVSVGHDMTRGHSAFRRRTSAGRSAEEVAATLSREVSGEPVVPAGDPAAEPASGGRTAAAATTSGEASAA